MMRIKSAIALALALVLCIARKSTQNASKSTPQHAELPDCAFSAWPQRRVSILCSRSDCCAPQFCITSTPIERILTLACCLLPSLLCFADEASARPAPRDSLGPKVLDAAGSVLQQLRTLKQTASKSASHFTLANDCQTFYSIRRQQESRPRPACLLACWSEHAERFPCNHWHNATDAHCC